MAALPLVNVVSANPGGSGPLADGIETGLCADNAGPDVDPSLTLRLIATSDLHACLLPYDYCANRAVAGRSLSEVSRQIAAARAEAPNSLLLDNGDFLQGNPLADYVASAPRRRRAHPVITAFNTLGYDAVTLGNHEFNYGIDFLSAALAQAQFPVVSANIATRLGKSPSRDKTFVPPFTILKRRVIDSAGHSHTLRIGVIGFAPPQIAVWDREHLGDHIRMRDILASARAWLPRLRARGADVIVALAHSGIGPAEPEDGMENAATALAALPEIDAVIAGHSHLTFPGQGIAAAPGIDPVLGLLSGKPAVMPGHSGSHVGIIDLVLSRTDQGHRRWIVASARARLGDKPGTTVITAPALRKAIGPDHRAALAWSRRVLGQTRVPLHSYFATTAPSAALGFIAAAKADHVRRALVGTDWGDLPVLGSAAPYRVGGRGGPENYTDIPAGVLRMRHLSDLYMFPNTLVALAVTGADLADWLELSAGLFRQTTPGATDAPLHDVAKPSFAFDTIPDLSYAIDLSQPARFVAVGRLVNPGARRIAGLSFEGRILDPARRMILVTNSHRASVAADGSGLMGHHSQPPQVVPVQSIRVQQVLEDHVATHGTVGTPASSPTGSPGWHFMPMPGTTLRIRSGQGSADHMADIAHMRPQRLADDAEGFAHFRLHL